MKDQHTIHQRCQIDHPISAGIVAHPYFSDTLPDRSHGLPISRLKSELNCEQIYPYSAANDRREGAQLLPAITKELYWFRLSHRHIERMYQNRYRFARSVWQEAALVCSLM